MDLVILLQITDIWINKIKIVGIVVIANLLFCICKLKETGGRREGAAPVSLFEVLQWGAPDGGYKAERV